jgi:integrase
MHYFGPWSDPDGALAKYLDQRDDLYAGRTPRVGGDGLTVRDLLNRFLSSKKHLLDAGELTRRTFNDYHSTCERIKGAFGLTRRADDLSPEDFEALRAQLAKTWGPVALGNEIQRVRVVFKYAYDNGLVAAPVRYGQGFKRPSKKVLRLHKAKQGPRLFSAEEVRALAGGALVVGRDGPELVRAGVHLRAMVLLGINCGFGNADCGALPLSALDLDAGVIDFPRPKTGIPRRCPLWPETVAALREALARRPQPKAAEAAGLVFVTSKGLPWAKDSDPGTISKELAKLLRPLLGVNGRKGLGFYTLRHTFRTVADGARDQPAADHIMGHEVPHMSSVYRESISDERLRAVADHVRAWLFPPKPARAKGRPKKGA